MPHAKHDPSILFDGQTTSGKPIPRKPNQYMYLYYCSLSLLLLTTYQHNIILLHHHSFHQSFVNNTNSIRNQRVVQRRPSKKKQKQKTKDQRSTIRNKIGIIETILVTNVSFLNVSVIHWTVALMKQCDVCSFTTCGGAIETAMPTKSNIETCASELVVIDSHSCEYFDNGSRSVKPYNKRVCVWK